MSRLGHATTSLRQTGTGIVLLGLCWGIASTDLRAQQTLPKTPAPSIDGGVEWINSDRPIQLSELRGKLVILDFWTYCCINCLQTLPDLKQLERAYPNELVVIGVHAPKFAGERDTKNIREAVLRHEVEHPVVNDANYAIARRYSVEGWPSLRIIDPEGNLIAAHYGEATFEALDTFMKQTLPKYRRKGVLNQTPRRFHSKIQEAQPAPLRFPGKVLADGDSNRLYVADSGHNRIVVASFDGKVLDVIGTGERGRHDGPFGQATFSAPQGMAMLGNAVYLADCENHLIRKLDFDTRRVSTLAGTGKQGTTEVVRGSRRPRTQDLASPWDLAIHDTWLYIAMAGTHQIWRMSLEQEFLQTFAGSGTEDIVDGRLRPRRAFQSGVAAFAQPTGLAVGQKYLYVADSEGSSIRAIDFEQGGNAKTVLGTPNLPRAQRLFTFGDRDGPTTSALLQHPMGVAFWENRLYVADTYNNKIKAIDLREAKIRTVADDEVTENSGATTGFDEPAGVSAASGKLFVADTNHHAIRVIDITGGGPVSSNPVETLSFSDLQPPGRAAKEKEREESR